MISKDVVDRALLLLKSSRAMNVEPDEVSFNAVVRMYVRTYVPTYVRACVSACVRACVRAYVRTYVRTYVHTYKYVRQT